MSHRLPDPRSELVIDVHELKRQAGTMLLVNRTVAAPEDMGIDMIGVPAGSPIVLDLKLESVVEGVLVTGTAQLHLRGECARCLDEISDTEWVEFQELFLYPGKELDDSEAHRIEGESIDLEPVLRDAVVLGLPFTPLCRPDCAGLCLQCGRSLNDEPEHSHGEAIDPRWADLAGWQTEQ